jgi:hypothetical protein
MAGPIETRPAINDLFVRWTTALDVGEVETIVGDFTISEDFTPITGVRCGV